MKTTFPFPRNSELIPHPSAVSVGAESKDTADAEHAQPEAARRFRALMAKQQGATEAAQPSKRIANEDTREQSKKPDEAETGQSPEDAMVLTANDTTQSNRRSDTNDAAHYGFAADKRSWGVRFKPPAAPSLMPSSKPPSASSHGRSSATSTAILNRTSRKPPRPRAAAVGTTASTHRLREPISEDNDLATSRAETLSHLVVQLLAKQAPIDRDALPKHAGAGDLNGEIGTVISIRIDHVFPETLLTLTISEPSIFLRFQSASPDSRALLSDQRNALASRVTNRTGRATQIEIAA